MSLGPVMLDIQGKELTQEDRELLAHPAIGGVILFTRNYESVEQLCSLNREIHQLRNPSLLIAVDHEGGRVQRFRQDFTEIPAARKFGEIYDQHPKIAQRLAKYAGWVLASELLACDVDFSFAPVVDLDHECSSVIGDRSFHSSNKVVSVLAKEMMYGMRDAGMAAVAKHFPGHGAVKEDSHLDLPVDGRSWDEIRHVDIQPFIDLIHANIKGIMPAHIIFEQVDDMPVGYSSTWLKQLLRKTYGFQGVIFSDDLSMEGANLGKSYPERAQMALDAGCDMVLVCNNRPAAIEVVESLDADLFPVTDLRLTRMHGEPRFGWHDLHNNAEWQTAVHELGNIVTNETFDLKFDG